MHASEYQRLAARTECIQANSRSRMCGQIGGATASPASGNQSPDLTPIRVNHAVIGMCGEIGEIAHLLLDGKHYDRDQLILEYGDLLWYAAEALNALDIQMSLLVSAAERPLYAESVLERHGLQATALLGMQVWAGRLASEVQRWIYYGKYPTDVGMRTFYDNVVHAYKKLLGFVEDAMRYSGLTMDGVMTANIAKLKARYPERYTDERAAEENRDRRAEEDAALGAEGRG